MANYFNEPFLINPAGKYKLGAKKNPLGTLLLWNPARKTRQAGGKKHRLNVIGSKGHLRASSKSKLATPGIKINPVKRHKKIVVKLTLKKHTGGLSARRHKISHRSKGVKTMKRRRISALSFSRPSFLSRGFGHRKVSHRRSHRNAFLKGIIPAGIVPTNLMGTVKDSLWISAGFVGVKVIPARFIPIDWRTGVKGYGVKALVTLGLSMASSKLIGKDAGKLVLLGGLVAMETELIGQGLDKAGITTVSENLGLGAYVDNNQMSAYVTQ